MIAVAFTGDSNSGKTTLIEKLTKLIKAKEPQKRVCIIKHDPKDKAKIDNDLKKDSARFFEAGGDVAILGLKQSTMRFHTPLSVESLIEKFGKSDYIFVEGLKEIPLPRICVARGEFNPRFLPFIKAIAIDSSINKELLSEYKLPILDLNNEQAILEWICENIKG